MRFVTSLGMFGVASCFPEITRKNVVIRHHDFDFKPRDILILEGGTDVNPKAYREPRGKFTSSPDLFRDSLEFDLVRQAVDMKIPILGICRGAQLLCVAAGGRLIQHVTNHTASHYIKTIHGKDIPISSTHHQMMYPWNVEKKKIISWTEGLSDTYLDGWNREVYFPPEAKQEKGEVIEPEIVFFEELKALAIQGHPEFLPLGHPGVEYCSNLIKEYLL
jgi:carbamoylphosphate synthase small subunit